MHIFNKIKEYGFKKSLEKAIFRFLILTKKYYSELGEDVILQHYCPKKTGFYVDIGAYHPKRISVTRMFYERGWRGINIEPNPNSIKAFNKIRRRDINLNVGVSDEVGELDYYYYGPRNEGNHFSIERYELYKNRNSLPQKIIKIKVDTLNNILENNLPKDMEIDFLTIDVEGSELKILKALNYEKYAPKHILVEDLDFWDKNKDFMDFQNTDLYQFLNMKKYIVVAKTWYTILFRKAELKDE
jgi:FkbM family methyltransferase